MLVQLAGAPGSGKTRLARALATRTGAAVLNSDIVKSTLLDAGVLWSVAGPAAYQTLFALADDLLGQDHDVLLDSPSHYAFIPDSGRRIAAGRGARYRFVECACADPAELRRRLAGRTPMRSQMRDLDQPPPDADAPPTAIRLGEHRWQTFGPPDGHLVVDTCGPFEPVLERVLGFVLGDPPGP